MFFKHAQNLSDIFAEGINDDSIKKLEETLKQNGIPQETIDSITKSLKESNPQDLNQNQVQQVPNVNENTTQTDLSPGKSLNSIDKIGTIKLNAEDFLDEIFEEEFEDLLNKGYSVDSARKSALDRLSFVQKYLAIWAEPAPTETVVQPGLAESAKEEDEKKKKKKKKH